MENKTNRVSDQMNALIAIIFLIGFTTYLVFVFSPLFETKESQIILSCKKTCFNDVKICKITDKEVICECK